MIQALVIAGIYVGGSLYQAYLLARVEARLDNWSAELRTQFGLFSGTPSAGLRTQSESLNAPIANFQACLLAELRKNHKELVVKFDEVAARLDRILERRP